MFARSRSGRTLVVTDHGEPVARVIPEAISVRERVEALKRAGAVAWSGQRLRPAKPVGKVRGDRTVGRSRRRESRVIAYLDASALVKRYLVERGSRETMVLTAESEMVATSIVSRAEVAAALAKAVRMGLVTEQLAQKGSTLVR